MPLLAGVIASAVIVLAVWWGALNQDEGWYLYAARLVAEGKLPYRDFFFTQGPALPFVYARFAALWSVPDGLLHGILAGRVLTACLGLLATGFGVLLVRRLVPPQRAGAAGLSVFAMLACNLYHVYFTAIPKTYALGSLFVLGGFWLLATGLQSGVWRFLAIPAAGFALALATGTRISLLLILPVTGVGLLLCFRRFGWAFLWFGLGGALGLLAVYGWFAWDPGSRAGLLAAQAYHAARGGFDPFFAVGSVSRLARGYAALGAVLFAWACCRARGPVPVETRDATHRPLIAMLLASFAAVFLLQLSAPFPYDDYQVPVMGILAVAICAPFATRVRRAGAFAVLLAGMCSFCSPLLQEWSTYGQDRFWSLKKEMTDMAKLRKVAHEIEWLDPGGTELLTQDLYLAVEAGRRVPAGFEMGPFCYFPELSPEEAKRRHVLSRAGLEDVLASAPVRLAAFSGYGFAISAPRVTETPFEEQKRFWEILKRNYELVDRERDFGQNATTLLILRRKDASAAAEDKGKDK